MSKVLCLCHCRFRSGKLLEKCREAYELAMQDMVNAGWLRADIEQLEDIDYSNHVFERSQLHWVGTELQ